jgi:hypothetical protein
MECCRLCAEHGDIELRRLVAGDAMVDLAVGLNGVLDVFTSLSF